MGIRSDIAKVVANMEKAAGPLSHVMSATGGPLAGIMAGNIEQSFNSINPLLTPQQRASNQASMAHKARGVMKGLKEVIPGILDFTGGSGAGLARGIVAPLTADRMGDVTFQDGWKEGQKLWSDYVTDPVRRLEMAAGGNKVRDWMNKNVQQAEAAAGGHNDWDDVSESLYSVGTEMAAGWPAFGKSIQAVFKGPQIAGKVLSKIPKVGPVASKVPSAATGYQTMGGPEIVDAVKDGWKWLAGRGWETNPELAKYRDENIEITKNYANQFIENGDREKFEKLKSTGGWGQLSEEDKQALLARAGEKQW